MSYDIDLLRVVSNKHTYMRFKEHVKKYNVSSITKDIFDVLGDYWGAYPANDDVDYTTLRTFFFIVKGKKVKDVAAYEAAFDLLNKSAPDTSLTSSILSQLIEKDYATQIYNEVLGIGAGISGRSIDNVRPLLDAYDKEIGKASSASLFVNPSLSYVSATVSAKGLAWRLPEFNVSLGPLRTGDFLILGARPETGKTTMMASEASFMLSQLAPDEHVIWINNEEASQKVMMRVIQSFYGITTADMLKDVAKYESGFLASGGNHFLILDDDAPIKSASQMERLFKENKPGLIIFDQLDKVGGFGNEREDLRIGALYEWARNLAKTYCPVIAISQLDGSAEGEKYPGMEKLRGSKTDKPGEADAIITIGNVKDGTLTRYLNVCKNKLFGGPETKEEHLHGCFEVSINPSIARYVSKFK